jgi:hypothetical protein
MKEFRDANLTLRLSINMDTGGASCVGLDTFTGAGGKLAPPEVKVIADEGAMMEAEVMRSGGGGNGKSSSLSYPPVAETDA